jgi:GT2 family glycosyltransferase
MKPSVSPLDARARAVLAAARARIRTLAPTPPAQAAAWWSDVTIIVKTFERPACIAQCLASIRRFYPTLPVLVCDDGREPLFADGFEPVEGVRWLTRPFSAGHTLGAGRNHLLRNVATPLFFLADDDHVFNPHTRLDVLHGVLHRHGLDIIGGSQERGDCSFATFKERDGFVEQHFHVYHEELEPGAVRCDRVANTFLARTARVRAVGWEERVHGAEHSDFFLRATRAGFRTGFVGYVYVDHDRSCEQATGWSGRLFGRWLPHRDRFYAWLRAGGDQAGADARQREQEFVLKKNGVRAIVHFSNQGRRAALEAKLGSPFYGRPPVPPSA